MDGITQIELFEGNVPYVYPDSEGWLTIGAGFLVDKRKGGGLFPEEIAFILRNRWEKATTLCTGAFSPWFPTLSPARQAVLIGMVYQLGLAGVLNFKKFLYSCSKGDFSSAATEMLDSRWAFQTPHRAKVLAKQLVSDTWVNPNDPL